LQYTISTLIVKKSNKELRICVNYKDFNILTIKNRNTLLLIEKSYNNYTRFNTIASSILLSLLTRFECVLITNTRQFLLFVTICLSTL